MIVYWNSRGSVKNSQQFKVFGGMLSLPDFTVEELAKHCGVKQSTVRSILLRNKDLREPAPTATNAEARRGGQSERFRIPELQRDALRKRVEEEYAVLESALRSQVSESGSKGPSRRAQAMLDWGKTLIADAVAKEAPDERQETLRDAEEAVAGAQRLVVSATPAWNAEIAAVQAQLGSAGAPRKRAAAVGAGCWPLEPRVTSPIGPTSEQMVIVLTNLWGVVMAGQSAPDRCIEAFGDYSQAVVAGKNVNELRCRVREELAKQTEFPYMFRTKEEIYVLGTTPGTYKEDVKLEVLTTGLGVPELPEELATFAVA
jgi:hypothetical protein